MKKFFTALYFVFLSWLILFKLSADIPNFVTSQSRSVNFIPFASSGGDMEILLNVIVFIPLAMLFGTITPKWKIYQQFFVLSSLSLVYELVQYFFAIGATDVTDWLTNSLGSLLGLLIYLGLKKVTNDKFTTAVAILVSLALMSMALLISHTDILGIRIRF